MNSQNIMYYYEEWSGNLHIIEHVDSSTTKCIIFTEKDKDYQYLP